LIILRFREERHAEPEASLEDLMARAVQTSGRAIFISGLAVFIALLGTFLLGDPLLSGMALGGALVVIVATAAGLTLVPAFLCLLHHHLGDRGTRTWVRPWARNAPSASAGFLTRSTQFSQRHPAGVMIGAGVVLVALAAPVLALALDSSDIRSLPAGAEERLAYTASTTGFSGFGIEPVTVVIDGTIDNPAVIALLDDISALDDVADADVIQGLPPSITAVDFTPVGDSATGVEARRMVTEARALGTNLPVLVTGPAAALIDTQAHLLQRIPLAAGVVVLSTFALLFALTHSIVVPLKALMLSALTMAATLGVLVAIFQWGWGSSLLGFDALGTLDVTTPLFIGLLAFGLTMDYEVFLLARIHERWRQRDTSADPRQANAEAVIHGITQTGPVVTIAAAAISILFLGFAAGELVAMKEIGIGMFVAVLLDVTIIRGFLLPATMTLLGRANWWPNASVRRSGRSTYDKVPMRVA
jgi:RND superfamily putative drug exporter